MNPYRPRPKAGLIKPRKPIYSFLKQVRGEYPFGQPNCEYCAEFSTVMQYLKDLSRGAHQWASMAVSGICVSNDERSRQYLLVGYSNPELGGLPNSLCFCFPLFRYNGARERELKHLVCFAPESAVPLSNGLYWEENQLKGDALEDWDCFWKPLSGCLRTDELRQVESAADNGELRVDLEALTLEGVSYKESVSALVAIWSQSRERLQDEIGG
ncbi:hypothetical protein HDF12_004369 [Edaphobacter lichenicola]|uniref:Uncharacterized protein n=1 Tax=Tunturiibacter lichenicola TaxID=2051959 RepID=A0A7Y9TCC8_9BACT|nr:hypothetical protein [Edaphobacter lichenicola]